MRYLLCLCLFACTPPLPPVPPSPDASDAAPPSSAPCGRACANMATVCGPQNPDCEATMTELEGAHMLREPSTGKPLTCSDVVAAGSKAAMRSIGVACP
jgi:hypothetical protein